MTKADAKPEPLAGVRVLDLATGTAGAVGRALAELGADVVRIEAPGGDADRRTGPGARGVSLAFAAANLGKRGITLDLATPADHAMLDALAGKADILIETTRPGSTDAAALDVDGLRARHPALVILSISDFGPGPCQDWIATDAVLQALGGSLSRSGLPGRAPLLPPGELAMQCAAAQAAYAALVAYLHRRQTGIGDHLDISLLDGAIQVLDPGYGIGGSATAGAPAAQAPRGRPDARHMYPVLPCKDGFVRLCILAARQWQGLFEWMGRPEAFADPAYNDIMKRFETPALLDAIAAFVAGKTRAEVEDGSQRNRFPAAPVLTLDEVLDTAQVSARGVFRDVALDDGITAPLPDGMLTIDGVRAAPAPVLPAPGGSAQALLRDWSDGAALSAVDGFGVPGRPLAGIRVLDLGVIVVGAEQGRLLADYGADVIKVESAAFPDGARASSPGGMSPGFAAGHRNKRGLGLNLRSEEGRALFLDLVERSDVVLTNFKPGTLESLGLSWDALAARHPGLILVESSAYGDSGPWSDRMGYGPLVRASAGLTSLWRYADDPTGYSDTVTIYPDHVAARVSVTAVLALLLRRAATGRGGRIALSQMEVMLGQMAPLVAQKVLARRGVALDGPPAQDAPWGVFPCAGDDEWCVVSVRDDADWQRLCAAIDRPDLAADPALRTAQGRIAARTRIDEAVAQWTAPRTPDAAMIALQAAGVPAGAMLRVADLPASPYVQSRPMLGVLDQPQLPDPVTVDNLPVRSGRLAVPPLAPAPVMGQHSAEIARGLLGCDTARIDKLFAERTLESRERKA